MQYQLIKSKRKTIAISFDRGGNLVVKAPWFVSDREVERFVQSKEEWILATAKRLAMQEKKKEAVRLQLVNGDQLPFLNEHLTLSVFREESSRCRVKKAGDRLLLFVPYEADYEIRRMAIEKWYRKMAAQWIRERAMLYAGMMQVSFSEIHIKDQRSRWGSCSGLSNLNFSFRLMLAPEAVAKYVVIHELCHLRYMDHSQNFWQMVEAFCPDYKVRKKWLAEHGNELYLF